MFIGLSVKWLIRYLLSTPDLHRDTPIPTSLYLTAPTLPPY